jgi:bifunctional DNase/RNase
MPVPVRIVSLLVDPKSGLPIIVLMETNGRRALPIVVGMAEAEAIALALRKTEVPRPRTHDLLRAAIEALGGEVARVVVTGLEASTFYARVYVETDGGTIDLDARPSDAIALAVRTRSPIFVAEHVIDEAHVRTAQEATSATEGEEPNDLRPILISHGASAEELSALLANLDPEDFGKYKM